MLALEASRKFDELPKAPSGVAGLDEVTRGGLPRGRPTLVCGSAGCGKTLLAMEFLVKGALDHAEPGVFMSFEETADDLAQNVASLGYDIPKLEQDGKLAIDVVRVRREEIEETGAYDLEGLFVRLGWAIDKIGARRVVLDTVEALFGGLENQGLLRSELRRLFDWLKDRGVTAVITAERGDGALTRHGLEEYVSDCVLLLDHRVNGQISTRRLRVVKYRGSSHGTNEYPFVIDEDGFTVLPVTSLGLSHPAPADRVSSGIPALDEMLDGGGFFRASSILLSGGSGTGKTSFGATFAQAACERGERCLFFSFEESPDQLVRNMRSIGLDLARWITEGSLRVEVARPTTFGIESHLSRMLRAIQKFGPDVVVVDPVSSLVGATAGEDTSAAILRLIDFVKGAGITGLFLAVAGRAESETDQRISSLMDSWLVLRESEHGGRLERAMGIVKSRGMDHSRDIRRFRLTDRGFAFDDGAGRDDDA